MIGKSAAFFLIVAAILIISLKNIVAIFPIFGAGYCHIK